MGSKILPFIKGLNEKQIFWILFGITFGLRLYAALMAKGISYDGAGYGFVARDFLRHDFVKGLSSAFHPFYPFLIFLFSPDTAHVEITGRFISLLFGTLAIIPLFFLVRKAIGQREAIFSALFYSFHSYLVTYSGMLLTEATYWGLLVLSVYFFWTGLTKEKLWGTVLSGFFLGLAYLTRPEGIGYVLVYIIWAVVDGGLKKKWFKRFILIGALILTVFIFVVPYVIYIHQETGQWLITKKGVSVQSELLYRTEGKDDQLREKVVEKPKSVVKNSYLPTIAKNIVQYIPFTTYHYFRAYHFALWLFLFFGLIRTRQNGIKGELFLASFVLFHLFSLSTFTKSTIRFSIPLIPLSLFWAGAGVLEIQKYFQRLKISNPGKWVSFLIILAILVQLPQSMRPERRHRADQKHLGLWLKENTPEDAIIMSNSPIEAFYGEREFILLPAGVYLPGTPAKSYKEIIQYAREKRVGYILMNKNTHEFNPDFEASIRSADLREFKRYKGNDGDWITVYEVIY
ncbi:MAG TPA: glycosyltransferase family 39 protein [Thermodesulfobacteriota bacterium]|nr:glycosyltransferase family 39 protein [Thermodesulfobacteriota bacterium]